MADRDVAGIRSGNRSSPAFGGFTPRRAQLKPLSTRGAPLGRWTALMWTFIWIAGGAVLAQLVLLSLTPSRSSSPLHLADPTPPRQAPTSAALALNPTPPAQASATATQTPLASTPTPTPTVLLSVAQTVVPNDPEMEPYLRLLSALDRMPSATGAEELTAVALEWPETGAAYEAHLALSRYHAALGDQDAAFHYQAALALDRPVHLRLEWAQYLDVSGRVAEAYSAFEDVARRFPGESLPAMARLAGDPIMLAGDLLDLGFPQQALDALPAGGTAPEYQLRAAALARLGRNDEALAEYQSWLALEPDSQAARVGRAQVLVRLGRLEDALAAYRSASGGTALLGEAQVLSALGRREEALDRYLFLSTAAGWWGAAGLLERLGRPAEALPHYSEIADSRSFLADDAAYRLWVLARTHGHELHELEARSRLEEFWPNYYTLLARGESFTTEVGSAIGPAEHVALRRAAALRDMGHEDWAARELVLASRGAQDPAQLLAFSQALFELGDHGASQRIAERDLLGQGITPLLAWRLSYPEAYPGLVRAAAHEFGLEPILIWSVMRQESRFNPQAVSRANAHGLMQVVPSTRDAIARALNVSADHESMFDPATSIRFGAYYLSQMLARFGGDVELAVAAYNGGGGTVSRSLADPMVSSRDDFYRWLSLAEPREFVNRVMLNYRIYQWLDGMPAPI